MFDFTVLQVTSDLKTPGQGASGSPGWRLSGGCHGPDSPPAAFLRYQCDGQIPDTNTIAAGCEETHLFDHRTLKFQRYIILCSNFV